MTPTMSDSEPTHVRTAASCSQLNPENPPLRKIAGLFTANCAAINLIGFLASNTS